MEYAVVYYPNGQEMKYVGSVADYQDGGFADPVMMTKEEAEQLVADLDHYVRNEEQFSDRDAALWAYEHKEWGFGVEEFDV